MTDTGRFFRKNKKSAKNNTKKLAKRAEQQARQFDRMSEGSGKGPESYFFR